MDKPKTRNGLAGHPQLPKIIDAILAGKSSREIATWTRPRVSFATISRFARHTVLPSLEAKKAQRLVEPLNNEENQGITDVATHDTALQQATKELIVSRPVLAIRENRLAAIQDRHDRMMKIVTERADEMKDEVAGGKSGFLVRDYKGKDGDIPVYKFDSKLATELREHEKHIAIELGEWQEAAAPNVAIQIVMPTALAPADAAERAPVIDIALPPRRNR